MFLLTAFGLLVHLHGGSGFGISEGKTLGSGVPVLGKSIRSLSEIGVGVLRSQGRTQFCKMAEVDLIKPEPKRKEDSLGEYLKYFERVAKANGWEDAKAARVFQGMLEVGSSDLDDVDATVLASFKELKAALTPTEDFSREVAVQKFVNLQMKHGEKAEDFLKRCKAAVQECYPSFAKTNKTQLVRDRFVHGLVPQLKHAVLNQRNAKLEEALQAAVMAESVRETLSREERFGKK